LDLVLLLTFIAVAALAASLIAILLFFVGYPLTIWVVSNIRAERRIPSGSRSERSVSLLVVVRNAECLIEDKIRNCLELRYPEHRLQLMFVSDGSTDATNRIIESWEKPRLELLTFADHVGKIPALNAGVERCTGEIVVFSDADALLAPDALEKLLRHFDDPGLGGVCGRRVISRDRTDLKRAQVSYVELDNRIKLMENRIGSITSNDGKLYAIRRDLFHPIPPAVTDDLYVALDVKRQGYRFVFEAEALAFIPVPSRDAVHEVRRRRRIVAQSLHGIHLMRMTLNPFHHGWFSVGLTINKVLRRALPFWLILLLASCAVLSVRFSWMAPLLIVQLAGYGLATLHGRLPGLARLTGAARFFVLGQYGTLLGALDFLSGRRVAKWDPVKTDTTAV
jgi:cellulose synthase/poly-beta-1,6-N-acetylglucosamine synthase-like glycosyltransferase